MIQSFGHQLIDSFTHLIHYIQSKVPLFRLLVDINGTVTEHVSEGRNSPSI